MVSQSLIPPTTAMAWVEVCDVVVVLPGSENSGGVKREIERAMRG